MAPVKFLAILLLGLAELCQTVSVSSARFHNESRRMASSHVAHLQSRSSGSAASANDWVLVDVVGGNPGDPLGWQESKYANPVVLRDMGFTGQVATGETTGTQALDFATTGYDFFPQGTPQRKWLDAYARGIQGFIDGAHNAGIKVYWDVDLLVLPIAVIEAFPDATNDKGKLVWNDVSRKLLTILVDEAFAKFPGCDGWIVRTGETYTYDTPYHRGNNPVDGSVADWVSFITTLRELVCVKYNKALFIRSWRAWPSDPSFYVEMTDQVEPHPLLYFSIKHSADDFKRPAQWNRMLGVGKHAQIVEVQLQREYEGKGAYPNYAMNGVIDGFPEMENRSGLQDVVTSPQIRGIWTWSRGGGWWGPYIHGNEQWIDLHMQVIVNWWKAGGSKSEAQVFEEITPSFLPGCSSATCIQAFRSFALMSAEVVLHGQWGMVSNCGSWMRDDRLGGLDQANRCFRVLGTQRPRWEASLFEKVWARNESFRMLELYETSIMPYLTDQHFADVMQVSTAYGTHLFSIVAAAWPLLGQAYRRTRGLSDLLSPRCLRAALEDYDAAFAAYRAYGLAEVYAPSLYHPYGLCIGLDCSSAFDPPAVNMQEKRIEGKNAFGMGHTVDTLRPEVAEEEAARLQKRTAIDRTGCWQYTLPEPEMKYW